MKPLFTLTLSLVLTMAGLIVAAGMVGRWDTTLPSIAVELTPTDDCDLPCWRGITPDKSAALDATTTFTLAGYTLFAQVDAYQSVQDFTLLTAERCRVRMSNRGGKVAELRLYRCADGTRLGDIIAYVGMPTGAVPDACAVTVPVGWVRVVPSAAGVVSPLATVDWIVLDNPAPSLTERQPAWGLITRDCQ